MPTITKLYSMAEISQHNTADDCWVLIDGRVYDVTRYLDEHPGGDDVLLEVTGKDSKDEFEDAGHSQEARELMKDYCIGELDPSTLTELSKSNKKAKHKAESSLPSFLNDYRNLLPVVVPVVIAGIVIAGIFFVKRKK